MSETSFKLKVEQSLNNVFVNYIEQISLKYNISYDELLHLWNGNVEKDNNLDNIKKDKKDGGDVKKEEDNIDPEKILKASKAELVAMCKKQGKKCSGTKNELISRLVSKPIVKKTKKKKKN